MAADGCCRMNITFESPKISDIRPWTQNLFCCSRIPCYFTFTFFFHFRLLSSARQLLGSTGCFTISAQRRHNCGSVKRGCAVWSQIFPICFIFSCFFIFTFFIPFSLFTMSQHNRPTVKRGFVRCGATFLQFSDIRRLWTDNPQSWFHKCRIGSSRNCSGSTLASHLFPTNRGSKA